MTPEPTVWDRYWGAFLGAAALLALAVAAVLSWIRLRRTRRDPHGLVLRLLDEHGEPLPGEHVAGHGHKQWYEFGVAEAHLSPRIERRAHGPYAVRRNPNGGAVLRRRDGGRTPLSSHAPVQLTEGLSLTLGEETRTPRNARNSFKRRGGSPFPAQATGTTPGTGPDGTGGTGTDTGTGAYDQTYL